MSEESNDNQQLSAEEQRRLHNERAAAEMRAAMAAEAPVPQLSRRRMGVVPILLGANALLVTAGLVVLAIYRPWLPRGAQAQEQDQTVVMTLVDDDPDAEPVGDDPQATTTAAAAAVETLPPAPRPQLDEPVSWARAEEAFSAGKYDQARAQYQALLTLAGDSAANAPIRDLMNLRIGQCLIAEGQVQAGRSHLAAAGESESLLVRGWALYRRAVDEMGAGQYLRARQRAYEALASLAGIEEASALELDCELLAVQALSRAVFHLHHEAPAMDWPALGARDPFAGLDQEKVLSLVSRRIAATESVLGPRVQKLHGPQAGLLKVSARLATAEELLGRFASASDLKLRWEGVGTNVRKRLLTIELSGLTEGRLAEMACGMVGLMAYYDGESIVVRDPQSYEDQAQRQRLLAKEAISGWRRLLLRAPQDSRMAVGHFALAAMTECTGDLSGAVREYHLAAERFETSDVAPRALLQAARVRVKLKDFGGARDDLLLLLDRYPGEGPAEEIYLSLGRAAAVEGLLSQAADSFRKVYFLNLSRDSRLEACLELGRCLAQLGKSEEASMWLTRYLGLAPNASGHALVEVYALLADSERAQGRTAQAVEAYQQALANRPAAARQHQLLLALAEVQLERGRHVAALAALSQADLNSLSGDPLSRHLLLSAQVYKAMGLNERAGGLLRKYAPKIDDPQVRARLGVEMAECYAARGDVAAATALLGEMIPKLEAGPQTRLATLRLAELAFEQGKSDVCVRLCDNLLAMESLEEATATRTRELLARAYMAQKDFEKAAVALAGAQAQEPQ
jgi:tetratricopeptide (TPR) repeat protein